PPPHSATLFPYTTLFRTSTSTCTPTTTCTSPGKESAATSSTTTTTGGTPAWTSSRPSRHTSRSRPMPQQRLQSLLAWPLALPRWGRGNTSELGEACLRTGSRASRPALQEPHQQERQGVPRGADRRPAVPAAQRAGRQRQRVQGRLRGRLRRAGRPPLHHPTTHA